MRQDLARDPLQWLGRMNSDSPSEVQDGNQQETIFESEYQRRVRRRIRCGRSAYGSEGGCAERQSGSGVMGVGGRGTALTTFFAERPDVEIAYVCDVNAQRLPGAVKLVQDKKGKAPKAVGNFQRILEDKNVDAMVCATPDHWHSLATVLACQAGKDIYVEKPASHDIWEGRKMVEAARKYHRVVQVGMQNRSSSYCGAARELIQSGKLGSVHLNDQNGLKYDQDKTFGGANLRVAFNQVKVLEENSYGQNGEFVGLDVKAMRTQSGCPAVEHLKNSRAMFLYLVEKVRSLDQKLVQQYRDDRDYEALEFYILRHLLGQRNGAPMKPV